MRKIARLLFGIYLLIAVMAAAGTAEAGLISTAEEIEMGNSYHDSLVKQAGGIYNHPEWQKKVETMGKQIAAVSDRPNLLWTFTVVNNKEINAYATLGGRVYVTKGLLDFVETDDELAAILGHEIGHIAKKHVVRAIERQFMTALILGVAIDDSSTRNTAFTVLSISMSRGYGFKAEHEADAKGVEYATRAGYNPYGAVVVMERLMDKYSDKTPKDLYNFVNPHPKFSTRINNFRKYIDKLGGKAKPQNVNGRAVVTLDGKELITYTKPLGQLSPWHRAELTAGVLNQWLAKGAQRDPVHIEEKDNGNTEIIVGGRVLAVADREEAASYGVTPGELAHNWIAKLQGHI